MTLPSRYLLLALAALSLSACEPVQPLATYRPTVDTSKVRPAKFERDLEACRAIATKVEADYKARQEKEMAQQMVAGLVVGALAGAVAGNNSGMHNDYIVAGAAAGALAGTQSGDYDHDIVTYGPRRVLDRCMAGRGYEILSDLGRG